MGYTLLCVGYPLLVVGLMIFYHAWRKQGKRAWIPLLLMLAVSPVIGYVTVLYYEGDSLLPVGGMVSCLALPAAAAFLMLYYMLNDFSKFRAKGVPDTGAALPWIIPVLCIVIVSASPMIGPRLAEIVCMRTDTQIAQPIIDALQSYREEQGTYPASLDALVPEYIDQLPVPFCRNQNSMGERFNPDNPQFFQLTECQRDDTFALWYKPFNFGYATRYNLKTGVWSRYGLWLQFVCEHIAQSG